METRRAGSEHGSERSGRLRRVNAACRIVRRERAVNLRGEHGEEQTTTPNYQAPASPLPFGSLSINSGYSLFMQSGQMQWLNWASVWLLT